MVFCIYFLTEAWTPVRFLKTLANVRYLELFALLVVSRSCSTHSVEVKIQVLSDWDKFDQSPTTTQYALCHVTESVTWNEAKTIENCSQETKQVRKAAEVSPFSKRIREYIGLYQAFNPDILELNVLIVHWIKTES